MNKAHLYDVTKIKNIAFDLFGVLITEPHVISNSLYNLLPEDKKCPHVKEEYELLSNGLISEVEFWETIGIKEWKEFRTVYLNSFELDPDFESLVKSLPTNISAGILSNCCSEWFEFLGAKYKFGKYFNPIVISGRQKVGKPNDQIYLDYIEMANIKSDEILFIDDRKRNLIPASRLGMKTVWYQKEIDDNKYSPDTTITNLKELTNMNV